MYLIRGISDRPGDQPFLFGFVDLPCISVDLNDYRFCGNSLIVCMGVVLILAPGDFEEGRLGGGPRPPILQCTVTHVAQGLTDRCAAIVRLRLVPDGNYLEAVEGILPGEDTSAGEIRAFGGFLPPLKPEEEGFTRLNEGNGWGILDCRLQLSKGKCSIRISEVLVRHVKLYYGLRNAMPSFRHDSTMTCTPGNGGV